MFTFCDVLNLSLRKYDERDEEYRKPISEEELVALYPEGSGRLTADNFEPVWWLLKHHPQTTFDDLKTGLAHLERTVQSHHDDRLSFLKVNIEAVCEELDTLVRLKKAYDKHDKENVANMDPLDMLTSSLQGGIKEARGMYDKLSEKQNAANAKRNALNCIDRYKFFFFLPQKMSNNIKRGNYDQVISDYIRVKSLHGSTKSKVIRKILVSVEDMIGELRKELKSRLRSARAGVSLDDQRRFVRYLVSLPATIGGGSGSSDAAWEVIQFKHRRLLRDLLRAHKNYSGLCHIAAKAPRDPKAVSLELGNDPDVYRCASYQEMMGRKRVQFVSKGAELLKTQLVTVFELGQACVSGGIGSSAFQQSSSNHNKELKSMMVKTVSMYMTLVRAVFLLPAQRWWTKNDLMEPDSDHGSHVEHLDAEDAVSYRDLELDFEDEDDKGSLEWPADLSFACEWVPECLKEVSEAMKLLGPGAAASGHSPLPHEAVDKFISGLSDLRMQGFRLVLQQTKATVHSMARYERWKIELDDRTGAVTKLPKLFESEMIALVKLLDTRVLSPEEGEPANQGVDEAFLSEMESLFVAVFQVFAIAQRDLGIAATGDPAAPVWNVVPRDRLDHPFLAGLKALLSATSGPGVKKTPAFNLATGCYVRPGSSNYVSHILNYPIPPTEEVVKVLDELTARTDPHPVLEIMRERGMDLVSGYGSNNSGVAGSVPAASVPSFAGVYTTSDRDQRMLVALSNLNYLSVATIPALDDAIRKARNVPRRPNLLKNMKAVLDEEIDAVIAAYLEAKGEPALGRIESAMYEDGFQWSFKGKVVGVSFYLREILLAMVSIHAQVMTLCPPFLDRIIGKMIESSAEELYRLLSCVVRFSLDGALQAHVDLTAFKEALKPKLTSQAKKYLQEAEHFLPPLSGQQKIQGLVSTFKEQTRAQFLCFIGD